MTGDTFHLYFIGYRKFGYYYNISYYVKVILYDMVVPTVIYFPSIRPSFKNHDHTTI